jgi:hypothetical protein
MRYRYVGRVQVRSLRVYSLQFGTTRCRYMARETGDATTVSACICRQMAMKPLLLKISVWVNVIILLHTDNKFDTDLRLNQE